jgi:hypothetical protein
MKSMPRRGLQNIRTMTDRIRDADSPQRKYLTLAMLELERVRRSKEKEIARQRVEHSDRRLAEIEEEQVSLLAAAEAEMAESSSASEPDAADGAESQAEQGFNLTY